MLTLRNLGEAALVFTVDHFDGREKRHRRVPGKFVREVPTDSFLHDDALGRRHAALQFAQNRERREGKDEATLHCVRRVSVQHVHVEVRLSGHETLFNAVALPTCARVAGVLQELRCSPTR